MAIDKEAAAAAKAKGNEFFKENEFEEAILHFSDAIAADPTDHVFYSNRSACYASTRKFDEALEDGKKCVELKPDWAKGYTRKGLAEFFLKKYDDSAETYKAGLKLAPEDATLKEGLKKAMDAKYDVPGAGAGSGPNVPSRGSPSGGASGGGGGGGAGGLFGNFNMAGLAAAAEKNPKIKGYMEDKNLMSQVNALMQLGSSNPQMQQQMVMQLMQQDPRILEVVMAAQGIDVSNMPGAGEMGEEGGPPRRAAQPPPKKEEPPPPADLRTPEQKEADEFKTKANELYKKKEFAEALEMYDKAIEKEPNDLTYYNNKCAVWIEMGRTDETFYDKVLETCDDLISRRYEINSANSGGASFEKVAKVFARKAAVHEKRKQWDLAIEMYNKSLTEDNHRNTRNALRDLEKNRERIEKEDYLDPEKAEKHREAGNEFFKGHKMADAKAEYDEGIKRNPKDPKLYSNRAAALTKLCAYPDAMRDLEECLKLDPKFIKAYSRKGACHFFMKEYHKAMQAYEQGLKIDPENKECIEGHQQVINKVQETQRSGVVDEEQVRHAMADPEIQNILKDPQINMFLKEMQENPTQAQGMMKDPKISEAVSKLMAAGVLRTA